MKCFFVGWLVAAPRCPAQGGQFNLASFSPRADGATDDTPALTRCFESVAKAGGGTVVIPPGDYFVSGGTPVSLSSRTTVSAYGARFHLPEKLGDQARGVVFSGQDVRDFNGCGGHFTCRCFDPKRDDNTWEPNVNTRMILITTSAGGRTENLTFRDISSERIAGAVVSVHGAAKAKSESEVETFARHVTVDNCTLLESGKFMWDYGYLWQVIVWPEDYEAWEVERARRYFRNDLTRAGIRMSDGDDRVCFDNRVKPVGVSKDAEPRSGLCFFGGTLPKNITRGRQYFVVESAADHIKVSEQPGGKPIRFQGASGDGVQLAYNFAGTFHGLYAPTGSASGKGGVDIMCARDVRITGCQLSALGDTMHVQRCRNVVFANNHIIGSRMGAFFLAEFCKNATVTGNMVDGTNGSRVMSVEKSCEDVTIIGNTFRNGGRGSWINQPKNFILQGNVFVNNTTKGESDPRRGRRSYETGEYRRWPELYFTLHEEKGAYGPVIVRDNVFALGEGCAEEAVTFAPNGRDLRMSGNVFQNRPAVIRVDPSCAGVAVQDNAGATLKRAAVGFNHGRR
ncbi:MAG: right-handed parallel beta-helix repeat-containing protein [Verrucomicrobia bacterium]|nr:right-handed parallel beta-helix repeat-containing protein [Verrucomicrobiota bacterium]